MKILKIILFLILCSLNINAQIRFLKRAQDEIGKNNLTKAYENLNSYLNKEGEKAEYFFIKACIELKQTENYLMIDTAFIDINEAEKQFLNNDSKKNEELCKEIGFCIDNIQNIKEKIDSNLYMSYGNLKNIEILNTFLNKYPTSKFIIEITKLRNKIAYDEAVVKNTEEDFIIFISKYPRTLEANLAKEDLWRVAFENASKINTIESYSNFINKYFDATQVKIAQNKIENIAWTKIEKLDSIGLFVEYINKYPNSEKNDVAKIKIENLTWAKTKLENKLIDYKEFINNFPDSKYMKEASDSLGSKSWAAIANSMDLKDFIDFKKNFEKSKFIALADIKIKELKSDVLPYLNKNKKYQLYNLNEKTFVDNNEYDQMAVMGKGMFLVSKYAKKGLINSEGKLLCPITYDCIGAFNNNFAQITIGDKYGFINNEGELIIQPTFLSVQKNDINGFVVEKEINGVKLFGYLDSNLQSIIPYVYENLTAIPYGFLATKKGVKSILDIDGKIIVNLNFTSISTLNNFASSMTSNLFKVEIKSKYGIIDYRGRTIIPTIYKEIYSVENGKYFIITTVENKSALIDSSKNILIQPGKYEINYLENSVFAIKKARENKLINNASDVTEEYYNYYTLFNVNSKKTLNAKPFDNISTGFSEGLLAVAINNKLGYINNNGDVIIEPVYDDVIYSDLPGMGGMGGMGGMDDEGYMDGNEPPSLYENCTITAIDGNNMEDYGFYNTPHDFFEGLAIVKLGDKYGYINKKGQIVIPIIYDYATSFYNGIAKVDIKENDVSKSKIINTKGEILVEELNISSFSKDFKYVYLHNSEQQYFRYNIKENKLEDLNENFITLNYFLNYSKGIYKDVDVYLNQDFKALMSEEIDFSKYESRELVKKGNDLYLYQSKFNEAIKMFEEAIEFDKNNKKAFLGMANVYEQKDNYNEAIKYFNKAIELDPDYIDAISQKAEYNFKNNYWNEALIDYRKLLNKNSNDYSVCFNKAICEQRLNLIDDAINTYTLYINNYTKSSAAYNNRGNALLQKGIYNRAIEDYTAAIKVGTNETKENLGIFYTNRGRAYSRLNKKNEACLDYKKGADLDNKDAISYYRYCK